MNFVKIYLLKKTDGEGRGEEERGTVSIFLIVLNEKARVKVGRGGWGRSKF